MSNLTDKLLLHNQTRLQLEGYLKQPSHALLILGNEGSGKKTVAQTVAARILNISGGSALESYPFFIHLTAVEKKEISIDQVRDLINKMKLKTPGRGTVRRVILIENAERMSDEAQNALLKNLEEPNEDTIFILTAPSDRSVLATIASRAQHIKVRPVALKEARQFYEDTYLDIESAWRLSQGSAGLLSALLSESKDHPLSGVVQDAKGLLRRNKYERIIALEPLIQDKAKLGLLLGAMGRVLAALQQAAIEKNNSSQSDKLLKDRKLLNELKAALEANTAPRFIILKLVMNLRV